MNNKLEISEDYLMVTLNSAAVKLVGEVMSNFDSISNPEDLKKTVKNTVYQNFRDLSGQIKAFDCGVKFYTPRQLSK